jgi:hypothetical protein
MTVTRWPKFLFQGLYAGRQIRMQAAYHVARHENLMQLKTMLLINKKLSINKIISDGKLKDEEQQNLHEN